ncbi:MAG: exodeoxyribonuclease I, partial [Gammaproteobacteria bacterium]
SPGQLVDWEPDFRDERLQTLYPRFRARNWPELLDEDERQRWRSFCEARLRDGEFGCDFTLADFQAELESVLQRSLTGEQVALMKQLTQWVSA